MRSEWESVEVLEQVSQHAGHTCYQDLSNLLCNCWQCSVTVWLWERWNIFDEDLRFIAEPETTETFCTKSASLQHDVSQHKPATAACCCTWLESVLNDNDSDIPIPSRMIVSQDSLGSFCTLVLGPYDMRPLLQPMLVVVEDSTFELRT